MVEGKKRNFCIVMVDEEKSYGGGKKRKRRCYGGGEKKKINSHIMGIREKKEKETAETRDRTRDL